MSSLGGGDVLAGATGAGFNEAIQGELSKIQDPALHQWASVFVGVVAAKAVGSDAQTGGSTAASGTKNNWYADEDEIDPLILLMTGGLAYLSSLIFPKNPYDFNPDGLNRGEWTGKNGKIIKWLNPATNQAEWEWNEDLAKGEHYHKTPDGNSREEHPDTGDDHMYPGDTVPE